MLNDSKRKIGVSTTTVLKNMTPSELVNSKNIYCFKFYLKQFKITTTKNTNLKSTQMY